MSSPPNLPREAERLRALHDTGLLDSSPEADFDDLVALAARICGTPIALVSLVDRNRQFFKAKIGLDVTETSRETSFCAHALPQPDEMLIVRDATLDARFADNPLVTGDPRIRFYAGVPLKLSSGFALGSLCVIDREPRRLTAEQEDGLRVLARQVVGQIELRRTLALVRADELKYRLLFESSPTPIIVYDTDTFAILAVNPAAAANYGYTREEFLRLTRRDLDPVEDLAALIEPAEPAPGPDRSPRSWRHVRKDGSVFPVALHTHDLTFEGQRARLMLAVDISESERATAALRASEERFQLVAQATRDALWDLDLVRRQTWWSDTLHQLFGGPPASASRERWLERIHPEERGPTAESFEAALASPADHWSAEYRFRVADGSYVNLHDRARILRDADGRPVRIIGAIADITERKLLEAQYLRAQRMESIGTLAGGIAHDLNNVLTPILMSIGLLRESVRFDADSQTILAGIEASTRRGASLVRQVLSIARGFEGQRGHVNLRHLVLDLDRIARETFPRSIAVTARAPRDLWTVSGDTAQLHQVLLNLLLNARDAMPAGGNLTLTAANHRVDSQYAGTDREIRPGDYVLVQVIDTGAGIPPAVLERIFEPFFTTKSVGQGTGLGLSTALAIVKSHGGFLRVASEPGRGTTFRLYLPAEVPADPATFLATAAADLPRGRGEVVLVLDDEALIRTVTRQTLETYGYEVLTAADGAEGVAVFAQHSHRIAAVLTDMMMPIMDGPATIHALLRIKPGIRIIAASGLNAQSHVDQAARAGVSDFLPKPYTAETMLTLLRTVLDRPVPR